MHALPGTPGVDVRVGHGGLGPLLFAAAVVAAVEDGEDDGEGGEADYEDDEHDDPLPMGREPVKVGEYQSSRILHGDFLDEARRRRRDVPWSIRCSVCVRHSLRIADCALA